MSSQLIESLAQRIRAIEQREHRAVRSDSTERGILQKVLPEVQDGSLVELLSAVPGSGAWTLALLFAKEACGERKALVIVDGQNSFYPPAACKLGIDLSRTIVVRALSPTRQRGNGVPSTEYSVLSTECSVQSTQHSVRSHQSSVLGTQHSVLSTRSSHFAAIVQSLRCPAVGAVMSWFENLPSLDFRRLQLAAEAGGGLGLILRPASALRAPSFAAARLLVTPQVSGKEEVRRMHIEAVRMRGRTGQSMIVEVNDETGHVHLPAQLAAAKTRSRASG